jgi:hypothetical protein
MGTFETCQLKMKQENNMKTYRVVLSSTRNNFLTRDFVNPYRDAKFFCEDGKLVFLCFHETCNVFPHLNGMKPGDAAIIELRKSPKPGFVSVRMTDADEQSIYINEETEPRLIYSWVLDALVDFRGDSDNPIWVSIKQAA